MAKSRACASIVGGAIGDALGMCLEIFPKSGDLEKIHAQVLNQRIESEFVTDFQSGGPWKSSGLILQAGEWTDDTAMLLCLADSLLARKSVDVGDLMMRFVQWWFKNYNACNGRSLGLGGNVKKALYAFDPRNAYELLGGTDPDKDAGNGALMRLAPVPVYYKDDFEEMIQAVKLQTATTHNVPETLEGSAIMANVIWMGIHGKSKNEIFDNIGSGLSLSHAGMIELASGAFKSKEEHEIRTLPGRCLWSLEAALWSVYHADSFEEAVVKAVNLGGDADTVGSIAGQIAGSIYGMEAIPDRWRDKLWHYQQIVDRAEALYGSN